MNKWPLLLALTLLLCTANSAAAKDDGLFSPISVRVSGGYISDADFKDSDAASSVVSGGVRLNAGGFSMNYEAQNYSWSNVKQLSFGNGQDDPWDTLHRLSIGYSHDGSFNKKWFYGASITGTSSFEEEISDSFGGAVRGHIGYVFNEHWKALIGARAFANSIRFSTMPYLRVMYENRDHDGSGFFMNIGLPENEAGYAFSDTTKIRFNFGIDGKTYRLSDDSTVAKEGYVELSSMTAGIYVDWNPLKNLSLSVGPQYTFSREIKTFDKHGDRFGPTIKQDSGIGGILSFRYKF